MVSEEEKQKIGELIEGIQKSQTKISKIKVKREKIGERIEKIERLRRVKLKGFGKQFAAIQRARLSGSAGAEAVRMKLLREMVRGEKVRILSTSARGFFKSREERDAELERKRRSRLTFLGRV